MIRHGFGLQMFSGQRNEDGVVTKYEGQWRRDKKHGQGSATFSDGSIYKGQFVRDVMEGQGTYTWVSGHEYKGHFKEGEMEGKGEFKHPSDPHKPLVGNFRRNQFEMVSYLKQLSAYLMFGVLNF